MAISQCDNSGISAGHALDGGGRLLGGFGCAASRKTFRQIEVTPNSRPSGTCPPSSQNTRGPVTSVKPPQLSPKSMALAFRIWAHCEPIGWNCLMSECADALGEHVASVSRVSVLKGWRLRFRTTLKDYEAARAAREAKNDPYGASA